MPKKVSLQIGPEARDALLPLRETDPVVYWNMSQTEAGGILMTLQHPTFTELIQPLKIPLMLISVLSLWTGFFVGRYVHAKSSRSVNHGS